MQEQVNDSYHGDFLKMLYDILPLLIGVCFTANEVNYIQLALECLFETDNLVLEPSIFDHMYNRFSLAVPHFTDMQVQELKPLAVQSWVNGLQTSPASGKPMSAATIKHTYHVLKGAMDKAVKNKLKVIRTRTLADSEIVVKEPKTESGTRTLDVPLPLMAKLKRHKVRCAERQLAMGRAYTVSDYIIVHPDGKPVYPEYLTQMLTKLQKKANLPKCRFHDLRHLCATIMLMKGVNVKVVQKILGHKDITTTLPSAWGRPVPKAAAAHRGPEADAGRRKKCDRGGDGGRL